jgi:hypothetical protein
MVIVTTVLIVRGKILKDISKEKRKEYPKWRKTIIKLLEMEIDSKAEINNGKIIVLLNGKNLDKNLIK